MYFGLGDLGESGWLLDSVANESSAGWQPANKTYITRDVGDGSESIEPRWLNAQLNYPTWARAVEKAGGSTDLPQEYGAIKGAWLYRFMKNGQRVGPLLALPPPTDRAFHPAILGAVLTGIGIAAAGTTAAAGATSAAGSATAVPAAAAAAAPAAAAAVPAAAAAAVPSTAALVGSTLIKAAPAVIGAIAKVAQTKAETTAAQQQAQAVQQQAAAIESISKTPAPLPSPSVFAPPPGSMPTAVTSFAPTDRTDTAAMPARSSMPSWAIPAAAIGVALVALPLLFKRKGSSHAR